MPENYCSECNKPADQPTVNNPSGRTVRILERLSGQLNQIQDQIRSLQDQLQSLQLGNDQGSVLDQLEKVLGLRNPQGSEPTRVFSVRDVTPELEGAIALAVEMADVPDEEYLAKVERLVVWLKEGITIVAQGGPPEGEFYDIFTLAKREGVGGSTQLATLALNRLVEEGFLVVAEPGHYHSTGKVP